MRVADRCNRPTRRQLCVIAAPLASFILLMHPLASRAVSGTWLGTQDNRWTNNDNWSNTPYPGSDYSETATFDSDGNGNTTLNMAGLWSVANIIFKDSAAAYTIGAVPRDSQTLVMGTDGTYRIDASAANSQNFNCRLQLGGGSPGGGYTLHNDAPGQTMTFGTIFVPVNSAGTKILRLRGSGAITVLGDIDKGPIKLALFVDCTNTVTLYGSNTLNQVNLNGPNGVLNLAAGSTTYFKNTSDTNIVASQDTTINGPGEIVLGSNTGDDHGNNAVASGRTLTINAKLTGDSGFRYYHGSSDYAGTIVLNNGQNDYARSTVLQAAGTLSCSVFGMSGAAGNLGTNERIVLNHAGARLLYTGTGETTDRTLDIQSGGILEHAGSGPLILTTPTTSTTTGAKTLTLCNSSAATGELRGAVVDGSGTVSLTKQGDGTWSLTASNTFSGTLDVRAGILVLSGAAGAAAAASACTVSNGATLLLDNTAAANNTDRLNDDCPVTLLGGTLDFSHDAGDADFSETTDDLTAGSGACTVQTDQAAAGKTSTLTFASLARLSNATLNFAGTGLGESDRNRVFITGQPEGLLGNWVTLNGQPAYYSVTYGVTALPWGFTEIAAHGSVIPNDATADVRITQPGGSGAITLAGDPVNSVAYLRQCTDTAATVDTTNKTLLAYRIGITNGQAALTLGLHVGDGVLAALTPGGILALDNYSGSALTVNAALADNGAASEVVKNGTGDVIIVGPTLYTGTTAINEGSLTFAGHNTTQRLAGAVSGSGTLVKTGTNLLDLAADNSCFTGPALLQQGITLVRQTGALGTADGGTVIADGATLDLGGAAAADALNLQQEPVTVQGAGTDGLGAIVNRSSYQQIYALGNVELSGNTTFGGTERWNISNGTLNMNNHAITKVGTSTVGLSGTEIVTPGGDNASIDVKEGSLRLQQSLQMNGSAANTVSLSSGTTLDFYDLVEAPAWSLICEDNTALRTTLGDNTLHNRWAGPVTLNGAFRAVFEAESDYRSGFAGEVSGSGSLLVTNTTSKQPRFFLTGANNTYRGATRIVNSWIYASSLKNVGEPSSLGQPTNATDGTIRLGSGNFPGRLAYTGSGDTTDRTIELSGSSTAGWGTLSHEGTGPLVISNVTFAAGAKRLYLIGNSTSTAEIASAITDSATGYTELVKQNNGTWILPANNTYSGATTLSKDGYGTLFYTGSNNLAGAFIIENGILRLPAGAFMKSAANFGIDFGGAFHLDGGTFIRNTPDPDGETFSFAYKAGGYGHLSVNSGKLACTRLYAGDRGIGTTRFSGGEASFTHYVHVGRYSFGTLTVMPGGSVSQPETKDLNDVYIGFDGGRGEVNLLGGTYTQARGVFSAGAGGTAPTSIVNLCAGTLTTRSFSLTLGALLVNFAGGTLKYPGLETSTAPLLPNKAASLVYSYGPRDGFAGGAVIDSNGRDVTLPGAVRAPTGQGVSAIAVQQKGSRYIGEPYVRISGDGYGACAVANMEDDGQGRGTYRVGSVTVTCPGVNYTTPPTVTFLGGECLVTAKVSTVTLAPNTSGGFSKTGAGTLTVSGANTYTGATTVAGGTLKLGSAAALPTQTPVLLAGGALDLNGYTVTNALGGVGQITNGTVVATLSPGGQGVVATDELTLAGATLRGTYLADVATSGGSDRVAVQGNIDLSGLALEIANPEALDRSQTYTLVTCTGTRTGQFASTNLTDSRWHVLYRTDGSVQLVFVNGTLIRVK